MNFSWALRFLAAACLGTLIGGQAWGCQCSRGFYYGKTPWEMANAEVSGAEAIFEGKAARFELDWRVFTAKVGDLIPMGFPGVRPGGGPEMIVTFRVERAYKGVLGAEAKVRTGLGGGDCGAIFTPGVSYLVLAGRSKGSGDLVASMCSPGGWIEDSSVAAELRYLRNEKAVAEDLEATSRPGEKHYAAQEEKRRREGEENARRWAAATGKICGTVVNEKLKGRDEDSGVVSFLYEAGFSPYAPPMAYVKEDRSFCSPQLGPGKYYMYFLRATREDYTSAVYYPGVSDKEKATEIEVQAGQTNSGVAFRVPEQGRYSVRGVVSIYDSSGETGRGVYVDLISADATPFPARYQENIDLETSSLPARVKYFVFENVLPGKYVACVTGLGQGWYSRKEEVQVTSHMKFISLEVVHQKAK